jgi:hypothetical protein
MNNLTQGGSGPRLTDEQIAERRAAAKARDKSRQEIEPKVRAAEANFAADFLARAVQALQEGGFAPIFQAQEMDPRLEYTYFKLDSSFRGPWEPICKLFVGPGYDPEDCPPNAFKMHDLLAPVFDQLQAEQREHCSSVCFSWGPTDRSLELPAHS